MKLDMKKIFQSILLGTGAGVRIAVIDSGVNPNFPGLRGKVGRVFDCSLSGKGLELKELPAFESSDRTGHGSLVQSWGIGCARSSDRPFPCAR